MHLAKASFQISQEIRPMWCVRWCSTHFVVYCAKTWRRAVLVMMPNSPWLIWELLVAQIQLLFDLFFLLLLGAYDHHHNIIILYIYLSLPTLTTATEKERKKEKEKDRIQRLNLCHQQLECSQGVSICSITWHGREYKQKFPPFGVSLEIRKKQMLGVTVDIFSSSPKRSEMMRLLPRARWCTKSKKIKEKAKRSK